MAGAGYKLFSTGDVLSASDVNLYLQQQTVMVFASAAARTTALSSVLAEGMVTYLKDTDVVEIYTGAAWVSLDDPNAIQNSLLTAKGSIVTATGASTPSALAVGTNGQTLVADSTASTGLKWATPAGGGSQTVLASGSLATGTGTTTFSSISASYLNLRLVVRNFNGSGNNALTMRVNNDTGSNYTFYNSGFGSSTARSTGQTAVTNWNLPFENFNAGNNSNLLVFDFPDYANTTTKKICFSQCCFQSADTATSIMDSIGGYSGANAAISRIDLTYASNVNGGTYILYGVN